MNEERGRDIFLVMFVVAVGIITWQEIHVNHRVPLPKRYLGTCAVFGALGVMAPMVSWTLAATFGVGVIIALLFAYNKARISAAPDNTGEIGANSDAQGTGTIGNAYPPGYIPQETR